jgi:hypothetical protein
VFRDYDQVPLTFHKNTPDREKREVLGVMEHVFRECLKIVEQREGDRTHMLHLYLHCTGMDSSFGFHPTGDKAVTLHDALSGDAILHMLRKFAKMIQSGKEVYLDNHSWLMVYTFGLPRGDATRMLTHSKPAFIKKCRSVIAVPGNMCLPKAVLIYQMYLKKEKGEISQSVFQHYYQRNTQLNVQAGKIYHDFNKNPEDFFSISEFPDLERYMRINLHVLSISSGSMEFVYHPKVVQEDFLTTHVLLCDEHFHAITNITAVLRDFSRSCLHRTVRTVLQDLRHSDTLIPTVSTNLKVMIRVCSHARGSSREPFTPTRVRKPVSSLVSSRSILPRAVARDQCCTSTLRPVCVGFIRKPKLLSLK